VQTALVTGGSGYVAGQLIALLLQEGYSVHATVRSLANPAKTRALNELVRKYPGRLELHEADLLREGAFDAPMRGCDWVFHVASPFLMPEQIKDGMKQVVEPALQGTRNVFAAVDRTPSVRRVVLTSTVGAIFGDYIDVRQMEGGVLSEAYFNTSSTPQNNPYHYSKVAAEKEAWDFCRRQSRWSMVAINPGLILGPALTAASDSGSLFLLDELLKGMFFYGAPDFSFTTVDVRDVALAHLRAAQREQAHGRYILAERQMVSFLDMSRLLRPVHRRPWLLPRWQVPNALVRLIGPAFGLTQDYIRNHLGIRFPVDNRRSIEELGITYRPIAETLRDHYAAWLTARAPSSH
jgi:nucleoside-diphosphate-sugar epimerase